MRKPVFGVSDQVRHKLSFTVQPQKMVRGLKFWIKLEEGLHYLCGENKGPDQLWIIMQLICAFVFCICKNQVLSYRSSYLGQGHSLTVNNSVKSNSCKQRGINLTIISLNE